VHHEDLDLDVSAGVRFHPAALALSAFFRAAQVRILGVDEETLRLWQRIELLSILFHHSNLALPERVDRALATAIVTPRMHGIHHSTRGDDLQRNFSSLLSCWDRLHGTIRLSGPHHLLTMGINGFDRPEDVTLRRSLALPFGDDARLASRLLSEGVWPRPS